MHCWQVVTRLLHCQFPMFSAQVSNNFPWKLSAQVEQMLSSHNCNVNFHSILHKYLINFFGNFYIRSNHLILSAQVKQMLSSCDGNINFHCFLHNFLITFFRNFLIRRNYQSLSAQVELFWATSFYSKETGRVSHGN